MRDPEARAAEIADRLVSMLPANKAYGGGVQRDQLVKMLRGPCQQLADLEAEMVRQRAQLEELMAPGWQPEGAVSPPFGRGRFRPCLADEWEVSLTPRKDER
jgi:hypothetical protein